MSTSPAAPLPPSSATGGPFKASAEASPVWTFTKRFLVGIILLGLMLPFAAAAALWLEAHRGTELASGIARLREHFESGDPSTAKRTETQVDARVGRLPLLLGRWILRATPAPAEAKLALGALREAQVSVWTGSGTGGEPGAVESMEILDQDMAQIQWERVAYVRDGQIEVIVYVDRFRATDGELSVCVAVNEPGTRVVAGGRVRPGGLADLFRLGQSRPGGPVPHFALR